MPDIEFIQYLRPNGRRRPVSVDRPEDVADKAALIVAAGYRLECEELNTGHVSLTIFDPDDEVDVGIEVVPNGPDVPDAVDKLIMSFDPPQSSKTPE